MDVDLILVWEEVGVSLGDSRVTQALTGVRAVESRYCVGGGISRPLLYHLIKTGQVDRDVAADGTRVRVQSPPKLAPYKPLIQERLAAYPALSAVRLLAECHAAGLWRWAAVNAGNNCTFSPGRIAHFHRTKLHTG